MSGIFSFCCRRRPADSQSGRDASKPLLGEEDGGPAFRSGAPVEIHGLQGAMDLNGKRGKLLMFDHQKSRWQVVVDGSKEPKLIKPANLIVLDAVEKKPWPVVGEKGKGKDADKENKKPDEVPGGKEDADGKPVSAYYHFASDGTKFQNKWDNFDVNEELDKLEENEQPIIEEVADEKAEPKEETPRPEVSLELQAMLDDAEGAMQRGDDKRCLVLYEEAQDLAPADWKTYYLRAQAYRKFNNPMKAFSVCRRGLEKLPNVRELQELMDASREEHHKKPRPPPVDFTKKAEEARELRNRNSGTCTNLPKR
eukprot:TRINITY_DN128_c1_g1_i1.p1 TRINITY_DN128_c1_g1~~TRINITY_DN128_c1_g1_i1.p1  ORF type:complete len:310 (+),score=107.93 TRINITY_DN128_c1_g1_i1:78-1007(+)